MLRWLLVCAALALAGGLQIIPVSAEGARSEGDRISAAHPDWRLPAWTRGGPTRWTMIGAPYAASVALVGADGSFAPRNHGPALDFWIYDADAGRLLGPEDFAPTLHLDDDFAPLVTGDWHADDLTISMIVFAGWPGGDVRTWFVSHGTGSDRAVSFIRMKVTTSAETQRHLSAYVALRPYGVEADIHPIETVRCDAASRTLVADDLVVLASIQPVAACGATSIQTADVSTFAARGQVPTVTAIDDANGRAEGVLQSDLTVSAAVPGVVEYRAPIGQLTADPPLIAQLIGADFDAERARVLDAWREATSRVVLDVSDSHINDAFRASESYLLLNRSGDRPRSGPLAHDADWIRDAAYIGQALERVGYGEEDRATFTRHMTTQRSDGSVPAIVDGSGARSVAELDSDAEAIAVAVEHYRFTSDRAWLAGVYPSLLRAAQDLRVLRQNTAWDGPETRGLLPPNVSAEDLGAANQHHYWDDFWALAGFRELAFAAAELGFAEDAKSLQQQAGDLQADIMRSIQSVDARSGSSFIPNGPEDVVSSSMARGTTPAVWPIAAFLDGETTPLLTRSFGTYFDMWLAPQGGGFRHYEGTLWPYGGLGIAHAMLRLGMAQQTWQIVDWTLSHQTIPNAYAWGEAINASTGGLELGDMPHSWAAAEWVSLVRDILLSEQDGVLLVNSGTPDAWLEPAQHVLLRNAPTYYGTASIEMRRAAATDGSPPDLDVTLSGAPPLGWRVRIPAGPQQIAIDGQAPVPFTAATIELPPGAHSVHVSYAALDVTTSPS